MYIKYAHMPGNSAKLLEPLSNDKGKADHLDKHVVYIIVEPHGVGQGLQSP